MNHESVGADVPNSGCLLYAAPPYDCADVTDCADDRIAESRFRPQAQRVPRD